MRISNKNNIENRKRLVIRIVQGFAGLVALSVLFNNCAPGKLQTHSASDVFAPGSGQMEKVSDFSGYELIYSENTLPTILSVTGLQTSSGALNTAMNRNVTKISETGQPDSLTPPMLIGLTSISNRACQDLVDAEKAISNTTQRRFFQKVDFSKGPQSITQDAKVDSIRRMARSFWGRNETQQELDLLVSAFEQEFKGIGDSSSKTPMTLMFLCTAMLASVDTFVN